MNKPEVIAIAERHQKTPAQVVLRWAIQRGTAIIPKSVKPERMAENLALNDFNLSTEEMGVISKFDLNRRFNDSGYFAEAVFGCYYPTYE